MVKTKELVICIISVLALILTITTNVFATTTPTLNELLGESTENTENLNNNNDEFSNIPSTTQNTNTNTNVIPENTNTNTNVNATNSIPNTGVSYSSIVIIAVAGISAIYAYKKIKEYNV